jgi:hypothetical protein
MQMHYKMLQQLAIDKLSSKITILFKIEGLGRDWTLSSQFLHIATKSIYTSNTP